MSEFSKTISGTAYLAAACVDGAVAALTAPFPKGTTRSDWAAVDTATVQVNIGGQDTFKGAAVSLALGSSLAITNNSGVTWPQGAPVTVSAKQPVLSVVGLPQAEYDALGAKERSTVYVTTGS
jgi:hypothetical protein